MARRHRPAKRWASFVSPTYRVDIFKNRIHESSREKLTHVPIFLSALLVSLNTYAVTPQAIVDGYIPQAKQENPAFKEFPTRRGEQFYHAKRVHSSGKQINCATCHTDNPKDVGAHAKTHKEIQPLAPVANKERFSDLAKVKKWFKRNCQDVLERACTAQEKGDFIAYLSLIK